MCLACIDYHDKQPLKHKEQKMCTVTNITWHSASSKKKTHNGCTVIFYFSWRHLMRMLFTILGWQWDYLVSLLGLNNSANLVSEIGPTFQKLTLLF